MDFDKNKKIPEIKISKLILIISVLILFFVSFRLREYKYAEVPLPGETRDEYSFGWLGISLLRDKYPTAWSGIGGYKYQSEEKINVDGIFDLHPEWTAFPINKPWFDHPPAFGLVVGGYAYSKGVRDFEDASVIILRRPMLKIGAISSVLVFILAYQLYGYLPAIVAGILYSTSPLIVISSRLALAENGYIPLFLLSIIGLFNFLKSGKSRWWYLTIVTSAFALLFKLSGVSIIISLLVLSFYKGRKQSRYMMKTILISGGLSFFAFVLYGLYFDWDVFRNIVFTNSSRFYGVGAEIFYNAFSQTKVTGAKYLSDGWIVASWISFIILAYKQKLKSNSVYLTVPVFSAIVVLIIFGSEAYGWYRFPILPFLIICLSKVLYDLWTENNFLFFILTLLPFGTFVHRLIGVEGFQKYVGGFRFVTILLFIIFVFYSKNNSKYATLVKKFMMTLTFLFVIYLSIRLVYFYTPGNWIFAT